MSCLFSYLTSNFQFFKFKSSKVTNLAIHWYYWFIASVLILTTFVLTTHINKWVLDHLLIRILIINYKTMTETKSQNIMKLEEYNAIVEDFNKLTSYSRKSENELKKKFKQWVPIFVCIHLNIKNHKHIAQIQGLKKFNLFSSIPASTLGSIISLLVQRSMKHSYRKSPQISSRYHEFYEGLMRDKSKENVILQ